MTTTKQQKAEVINEMIRLAGDDIDKNSISDGYHTFGELYAHRNRLYIALLNLIQIQNRATGEVLWDVWKAKKHDDGSMFDGWFIAGIKRGPEFGDITYHLPMELWEDLVVPEKDKAPEWDGHSPNDVLERLKDF